MKNKMLGTGLLIHIVITVFFMHASFALAADKVVVVPLSSNSSPGTVITTVGPEAWLPHTGNPTTVDRFIGRVAVSGDGKMVLGVNAPASINGVEFGLESVEICIGVTAPGYLDQFAVVRTNSAANVSTILADVTERTADGCYVYHVGETTGKGIGIILTLLGGGEIDIYGTTFTWKKIGSLTP
ncbi:MAG: hypothetical protein ACWGN1_04420 [Desulfobulbales bacterium]